MKVIEQISKDKYVVFCTYSPNHTVMKVIDRISRGDYVVFCCYSSNYIGAPCDWVNKCNGSAGSCFGCPAKGSTERMTYDEAKAWWEKH